MAQSEWARSRGPEADDDLRVLAEPDDLRDAPLRDDRDDRDEWDDHGDDFQLPDGMPDDLVAEVPDAMPGEMPDEMPIELPADNWLP
ncbi:hypothetical protein [Streptacidiphilus fuscans]|uniref:Uncharacterized protein n=1 Tax=Streptacidiphilus fuscans TaxID=2789292 RepID=A0A931B4U7_9ACTN|nr:hypothetical protein [Streptacidiphilus fuscans]MBF9066930.1 hypothetical protein [Streptacidiphilus fuscans]